MVMVMVVGVVKGGNGPTTNTNNKPTKKATNANTNHTNIIRARGGTNTLISLLPSQLLKITSKAMLRSEQNMLVCT